MSEEIKEHAESVDATETASNPLLECQKERDEWKDRCLRSAADFENLKKRTEKEKMVWISTAQTTLLQDVIAIVDDFDRAFCQPTENESALRSGLELVYKEFQKLLEKYGVTIMPDAKQFDPLMHEAIMQVESEQHASGDIVQVLQKGYLLKGNVLRPARVSVAK